MDERTKKRYTIRRTLGARILALKIFETRKRFAMQNKNF